MKAGRVEGAADGPPWRRIATVWLLLAALMLAVGAQNVLNGQFTDPDDTLRMVQLRDLLGGQAWFDVTQYRIDPPHGVPMHWSRLVDVPLALVALALTPLVGAAPAQTAAAVLVPLLTLGCLVALVGWIASRRFDPETTGMACLACALVPATVANFQPMRIDHHGWQVVLVMAASATLFAARARRGAAVAALALAGGLSISLEVLPLAAAFAGLLALRWLSDPARPSELVPFLATLAGGLLAIFAATRGPIALAPWCDAIAPAHLAFFAVVASGCWLLGQLRLRRPALLGGMALTGLLGLSAYAAVAPQCLATPFGSLDPLVRHYWYENIAEGLPIWRQRPGELLVTLVPLLAGVIGLGMLWRSSANEERRLWTEYALLFAAAFATGLLVWRSMAFAGALAAVPLGWLIVRALETLRKRATTAGVAVAAVCAAFAGLGSLPVPAAQAQNSSSREVRPLRQSDCELPRHAGRLDRMAPTTIFAPLDIGPVLLERSHHATVATSHHRAQEAMRDVITAFMADERTARDIVARHGAGLMVVCTDLAEPGIYSSNAPEGLMAQILRDRPPAWLEPVEIGGPPELRIWRVTDEASDG